MKYRRTQVLKLVLLASVSLTTACSTQQPTNRMTYRTYQECVQEWGDPALCERPATTGGFFLGPRFLYSGGSYRYWRNGRLEAPPPSGQIGRTGSSTLSTGTVSVPRGGFGSSSRGVGGWGG